MLPPSHEKGDDKHLWSGYQGGVFTISSAYSLLCGFNDDALDDGWSKIWSLKVPERVQSFIWLVKHDRIITDYMKSKMLIGEHWCTVTDDVATTIHVFVRLPSGKSDLV